MSPRSVKPGVRVIDSQGDNVQRKVSPKRTVGGCGGKRRVSALHAQGNLRGNRGRIAQTLEERVAHGKLLEAAFGPAATEVFKRTEAVANRCLRNELPLRCSREVLPGADCTGAVLGGNRQRISLSQSGRAAQHAVRHDFAIRRNCRHARGSPYGKTSRLSFRDLSICNVPEKFAACANRNW